MRVGRRTTAAARSPRAPTPTADSPAATATRATCSTRGRAAAPRSPAVRAAMLSRFRRLQTIFLKQVSRFCSRGCDPAQRPYAARSSPQSGVHVPKVPGMVVRTGGESAPCSGAFGQTCDFVCDDGEHSTTAVLTIFLPSQLGWALTPTPRRAAGYTAVGVATCQQVRFFD